ncbi:MAG TPA: ATP-dependent Clp protease adapter ClpS [Candidatus Hydrogenedentes bacterium]|nr:ATP-dependent Clp protease adapter ClpS [Candidatus Hydrogenedentota bacterium]HPG70061.1 ATP-dependent Clp protease adapter ClpS [Candidatus Hydrogenedentota bacterium]
MPQYVNQPTPSPVVKPEQDVQPPHLFKVLLLNDHYTTMDFVVSVLEKVFRKPHDTAVRIMLEVHQNGSGVAGVYPSEVAETKVETVHRLAADHGYPLRCSMEPE